MIALEGRRMGYRFVTLDPTPDSPCAQVCDRQIVAAYDDIVAAEELARSCDVITYEFENVSHEVAATLAEQAYVPQGSRLLWTTQHRVREKSTLAAAGVQVTPFHGVASLTDLEAAAATLGLPLVLKTSTGGYDGKGQWRIESEDDLARVWQEATGGDAALPDSARPGFAELEVAGPGATGSGATELDVAGRHAGQTGSSDAIDAPFIAEAWVDLDCELSAVVARSPQGEVRVFPVAENEHKNHILHLSIVPARVSEELRAQAESVALRVAEALDVIGLVAVEMFVTRDGKLYVNELAPRPHNSGHYTYDACATSQFEQHVRAICNLPLGDVTLWSPVVMVNVLGQHQGAVVEAAGHLPPNAKLHLYGKAKAAVNRKMGHLTVLAPSVDEALEQIEALGIWSE